MLDLYEIHLLQIFSLILWLIFSLLILSAFFWFFCLDGQYGAVFQCSDSGVICLSVSPDFATCPSNWSYHSDSLIFSSVKWREYYCHPIEKLEWSQHVVSKHCINGSHYFWDYLLFCMVWAQLLIGSCPLPILSLLTLFKAHWPLPPPQGVCPSVSSFWSAFYPIYLCLALLSHCSGFLAVISRSSPKVMGFPMFGRNHCPLLLAIPERRGALQEQRGRRRGSLRLRGKGVCMFREWWRLSPALWECSWKVARPQGKDAPRKTGGPRSAKDPQAPGLTRTLQSHLGWRHHVDWSRVYTGDSQVDWGLGRHFLLPTMTWNSIYSASDWG